MESAYKQWLRIGTYEMITALGMLGVVHVCLAVRHDPWIINPTLTMGELIALYGVTAVASESAIVSNLRPATGPLLAINLLAAAIITQPGWSRPYILKDLVGVAIATVTLRMLVAAITLRVSKVSIRRFASALVGAALLLETTWTGFNLGEQAYYSYYVFPRFKEGYIMPTRWQDFVAMAVLWGGTLLLLYVSYRLLKYAVRAQSVPNSA